MRGYGAPYINEQLCTSQTTDQTTGTNVYCSELLYYLAVPFLPSEARCPEVKQETRAHPQKIREVYHTCTCFTKESLGRKIQTLIIEHAVSPVALLRCRWRMYPSTVPRPASWPSGSLPPAPLPSYYYYPQTPAAALLYSNELTNPSGPVDMRPAAP